MTHELGMSRITIQAALFNAATQVENSAMLSSKASASCMPADMTLMQEQG